MVFGYFCLKKAICHSEKRFGLTKLFVYFFGFHGFYTIPFILFRYLIANEFAVGHESQ